MKRILCIVAVLCLMAGCFSFSAFADDAGSFCIHHVHDADCGGSVDENCSFACEACAYEIQLLVDLLPEKQDINDGNRENVINMLNAVDERKASVNDATRALVDYKKYSDAVFVINTPENHFRFCIEKRYEEGVSYTPDADIAFLDGSGQPVGIIIGDYMFSSVQLSHSGAPVYGYLPEGNYAVNEIVDGHWRLTVNVDGVQSPDGTVSGLAGEEYDIGLVNGYEKVNIISPEEELSELMLAVGDKKQLSVKAENVNHYRWELSRDGGNSYEAVQEGFSASFEAGVSTFTLDIGPAAKENDGWIYRFTASAYEGGEESHRSFRLKVTAPASGVPATGDMSSMPLWTGLFLLFAATAMLTAKKKNS